MTTKMRMQYFGMALGIAIGVAGLSILIARRRADWEGRFDGFGAELDEEQTVIVRTTLEEAEAGWVNWCASGHARLTNNYAVRFEPAAAEGGTQVHLSGGGARAKVREELRRYKQLLETGEVADRGKG
ncbi:MAG: hypothetical protein EXQ55_07965 [Acidobacteria bacterium]|nr:hypothetical protein [Acidobacteriota bacterium]